MSDHEYDQEITDEINREEYPWWREDQDREKLNDKVKLGIDIWHSCADERVRKSKPIDVDTFSRGSKNSGPSPVEHIQKWKHSIGGG